MTDRPVKLLPNSKLAPTRGRARILVIIPTLGDRIKLLHETLKSVTSQSSQEVDVVLVCPRKSTAARKMAKKFGAAILDDPGSLTAAINVGLKHAKPWHDYVTEIGDDDLLTPGSLAITITALDANPSAVLAYGYCNYIDTNGCVIFTSRAGRIAPWLMSWGPNLVPLPGLVFRLSAIHKVGVFDANLKYSMDLDMYLRLRKIGKFINTGQILASFRWHPSSITVANRKTSLDEAQQVKRRYVSNMSRRIAPVWEIPVRIATKLAVNRVNARAIKIKHNKQS